MMMLEDDDYNESIENIIDSQKVNAEYAVAVTADNFAEMFASMDDPYMQARAADVKDISNRIIANLTGNVSDGSAGDDKMIVCADDLAPSETISLDKDKVLAFVTAHGSSNSHTAILARNMNIPAVIGVGSKFLSEIKDGDFAIVDGFTGEIFVDPDEKTTAELTAKQKADEEKKRLLQTLKGKENVTKDGKKINIYANIGSVGDVASVLANDAGGIGLFRSEFLYLESRDYPTEEEQFAAYRKVAEAMAGKKVIIRTLDIGADKQVDYFGLDKEDNPAMGYRAIRICLDRREVFKTQLRALYRASYYGTIAIMFPMIISVKDRIIPIRTPLIVPSISTPKNAPIKMKPSVRLTFHNFAASLNSVAPSNAEITIAVNTGTGRYPINPVPQTRRISMDAPATILINWVFPWYCSPIAVLETDPLIGQQPVSAATRFPAAKAKSS